jgi:hypothetical protein
MHELNKDSDEFRRERYATQEESSASPLRFSSEHDDLYPGTTIHSVHHVHSLNFIDDNEVRTIEAPAHREPGSPNAAADLRESPQNERDD